jgi:hypothetical protein
MFGILGFLLKFIDPISAITKQIADAFIAQTNAQTEQEQIKAKIDIAALQAKQAVLISEARTPINQFVRLALTFPACAFLWKVIIWDKLLGWGVTDGLSQNLWYYVFMVLSFYFVDNAISMFKRRR